jgi:hypothetical protein
METAEDFLYDWSRPFTQEHKGLVVSFLVSVDPMAWGEFSPEQAENAYQIIAQETAQVANADAAFGSYVDDNIGASGWGIGISLEFIQAAADVVSLATAAISASVGIAKAIQYLRRKLSIPDDRSITLSRDTLKVLTIAEICSGENIQPSQIRKVRALTHTGNLGESRTDLRDFYSAYTITVEAEPNEQVYLVWNYLVSCQGHVIAATRTLVPNPPMSGWKDVSLPERRLKGIA